MQLAALLFFRLITNDTHTNKDNTSFLKLSVKRKFCSVCIPLKPLELGCLLLELSFFMIQLLTSKIILMFPPHVNSRIQKTKKENTESNKY